MTRTEHTTFAGHELVAVVDDGPAPCWQLKDPNNPSEHTTVLITATPKGVVIQCDRLNATSTLTLTDFVGQLDEDYLKSQFLQRKWSPMRARECFGDILRNLDQLNDLGVEEAGEQAEKLRRLRRSTQEMFASPEAWERYLGDLIGDMVDGVGRFSDPLIETSQTVPEMAYDHEEATKLVSIHNRFREEFLHAYRIEDDRPIPR